MTPHQTKKFLERVKGIWQRFPLTEGLAQEWQQAFQHCPPAVLDKALSEHVKLSKWAPTISELHALLVDKQPARKAKGEASSLGERWKYVQAQLAAGRCYIREAHPRGSIAFYVPADGAIEVGQWVYGSLLLPRFVAKYTEVPETQWGRGETWQF